jgi:O-antigen/teichoic acid export membrane protein
MTERAKNRVYVFGKGLLSCFRTLEPSERWDVICTALINLSSRGMSALVSIFVLPVLLKQHGQSGTALWASAIALSSVFAFADLGLSNAIMNRNAKLHATGQSSQGLALIGHAFAINALVVSILIAVVLILAYNSDVGGRILGASLGSETAPVLLSASVPLLIAAPFTIITKAAAAESRAREEALWQMAATALTLVSLFFIARHQTSLWISVLAFTVWSALARILQAVQYAFKRNPINITLYGTREIIDSGVARSALLFMSLQAASTIAFSLDAWILNGIAHTRDTVIYVGILKLYAIPQLVVSAVAGSLWPQMARMLARNQYVELKNLLIASSLLSSIAISAFGALLFFFRAPLFGEWLGAEYIPSASILVLVTMTSAVITVGTVWGLALNAMEIMKFQIISALFMSTGLVLLKIILSKSIGLIGLPIATLVTYVPVSLIPSLLIVSSRLRACPRNNLRSIMSSAAP